MSLTAFGTLNVCEKSPIFFTRPLLIICTKIWEMWEKTIFDQILNLAFFKSKVLL